MWCCNEEFIKYEKQRETKTETNLGHCKIQETKLLFLSLIALLDNVNILVNHTHQGHGKV